MKVNCQNNKDILFKGFYDSKALKKCLEFAANNGTLFAATTSIALSGIRPLVILATPDTDKKNKQSKKYMLNKFFTHKKNYSL